MHSLGKTLLVFALLHSVLQAKFACYSRCFLSLYFCSPVPYNEKDILPASKVMLKILQARLQRLPDVQAGFRKGRGTRDQLATICWIIEKARGFHENIYFCFTDYAKAFDCVYHNKLWNILKEMGVPDHHLTCLLRSLLYASQEAIVRIKHGTTEWLKSGKEFR